MAEQKISATFVAERVLACAPADVDEAFRKADVLARWWGPKDFTNTFETFEFAPGGRWKYVMHGPGGKHHDNESVFREVQPGRVVIHHVSLPRYTLTVTYAPFGGGTRIRWSQEFEDATVAAKIRHIVEPANEQNLDRLQAAVGK